MLGLFYLLDTLHRVIIIGRGYVCTSRKVWNWRRSGNESVQIENRRKRRRKRRGLENFSMKLAKELIQRRRLFTVSVFVDLQDYQL